WMCARYSSANDFNVLTTGFGADWPRPQRLVFLSRSQSSSSIFRSCSVAVRSVIALNMRCIWYVPTRHGTHFPQDSVMQKSMKYLATSTMQELSSITIMPPDPMMEPALASDSYSTGISRVSLGRHPSEGPPV